MTTAKPNSRGQITLPKAIRDDLKLGAGDKIDFERDGYGCYVLHPANRDVRELSGFLARMYEGAPVSVRDMDKAIADTMRRKHSRPAGAPIGSAEKKSTGK
jgi:antitoxin PrlF